MKLFKNIRLRMGFNQKQMGDRLGVHQASISNYERSERWPDKETLLLYLDIAEELDMDVNITDLKESA